MSTENKAIVEKVNAAFGEGSTEGFLSHCAEDVQWTIVGKPALQGKEAIRKFMGAMGDGCGPQLVVHSVIGDGEKVASNGSMIMELADGTPYHGAFCDVYRFAGGKIAELDSYVVDLKS